MGYIPQPEVMLLLAADQKQFIGEVLVLKTLMYFGGLINKMVNRIDIAPDFPGMAKAIEAAVKLDPYNMDCYYFTQAVTVWDMKQVKTANEMLEYGMKYRDWDWYLPYFAGFNYAYFLKDYETAAKYYKRVGELTGNELSMSLASRYMYEAGQTRTAIAYLSALEKSVRNDAVRKNFQIRLQAFRGVELIEEALNRYVKDKRREPATVETLLKSGFLKNRPVDPYGGTYYLDEKGQVRSTSKFAFPVKK